MAGDRSQRTEKPTPRRLQKARGEGNVPRSKELPGALGLIAFLIFAELAGSDWLARMKALLVSSFEQLPHHELTPTTVRILFGALGSSLVGLLALPLGALVVAGVGGNLLQGTPTWTLKPVQPDLSKLQPIQGLKKLFRAKPWVEMLKGALKMVLFTVIAVSAIREGMVEGLPVSPGAEGTFAALLILAGKVMFRVAMFALGLALLDLLFTRYDHKRQLRMSKQELKEERKEAEGDPLVKAKIKSKQMSLARTRMMADVPRATVVITNPTRFAVALRYIPGEMDVPQLLAKGRDKLAVRIRGIAEEHGVPIISDPPLARSLYRAVAVGGFIPPNLFRAVAEVLALVLQPRGGAR